MLPEAHLRSMGSLLCVPTEIAGGQPLICGLPVPAQRPGVSAPGSQRCSRGALHRLAAAAAPQQQCGWCSASQGRGCAAPAAPRTCNMQGRPGVPVLPSLPAGCHVLAAVPGPHASLRLIADTHTRRQPHWPNCKAVLLGTPDMPAASRMHTMQQIDIPASTRMDTKQQMARRCSAVQGRAVQGRAVQGRSGHGSAAQRSTGRGCALSATACGDI